MGRIGSEVRINASFQNNSCRVLSYGRHFYFSHIATSIVGWLVYLAMEIDYMIKIHIITEVDVKLNKWHIAMEKLYRKPTETKQNFKKKL